MITLLYSLLVKHRQGLAEIVGTCLTAAAVASWHGGRGVLLVVAAAVLLKSADWELQKSRQKP